MGRRPVQAQEPDRRQTPDEEEIEDEVKKAESFNPSLSSFTIATTATRDAKTQEIVRTLATEREARCAFRVTVAAWEDIVQDLAGDRS